VFIFSGLALAENLPPDLLVKTVVSDVLDTIKNTKVDNKGSREKALVLAKEKILPHIDFERMTKLAVGKGWRNANAQQRQSLVAQFSTLVTRTYSSAIDAYQGQEALVDP
jgi:phospholipid transport system substrate-binding protein